MSFIGGEYVDRSGQGSWVVHEGNVVAMIDKRDNSLRPVPTDFRYSIVQRLFALAVEKGVCSLVESPPAPFTVRDGVSIADGLYIDPAGLNYVKGGKVVWITVEGVAHVLSDSDNDPVARIMWDTMNAVFPAALAENNILKYVGPISLDPTGSVADEIVTGATQTVGEAIRDGVDRKLTAADYNLADGFYHGPGEADGIELKDGLPVAVMVEGVILEQEASPVQTQKVFIALRYGIDNGSLHLHPVGSYQRLTGDEARAYVAEHPDVVGEEADAEHGTLVFDPAAPVGTEAVTLMDGYWYNRAHQDQWVTTKDGICISITNALETPGCTYTFDEQEQAHNTEELKKLVLTGNAVYGGPTPPQAPNCEQAA